MAGEKAGDDAGVVGRRFVHVHEEDTPHGEVYRPDGVGVPKSRRPRESLVLHPDGTATVGSGGADDRHVAADATWRREKGEIVLRLAAGRGRRAAVMRVVEASSDRLVVRR